MGKKRILIFVVLSILFVSCLVTMNIRFDRLSRYPYEDEEARELINRIMTDDEIEFIIEYSIDPTYFIDYIECNGFNIYHVETYDETKRYCWYLSNQNIVQLVEKMYRRFDSDMIDDVLHLFDSYSYEEVDYFLDNLDKYGNADFLYSNPDDIHIHLDEKAFIGCHTPRELIESENICLKEKALEKLNLALEELNKTFNRDDYGGIVFSNSYISYTELEKFYKDNKKIIPGHNEHQTGLCVDIDLSDSIFVDEEKINIMKEVFERFGFELTSCELSDYHLRFNPGYIS